MAAQDGTAALGREKKKPLSVKLIKTAVSNRMLSLSERTDSTEVALKCPLLIGLKTKCQSACNYFDPPIKRLRILVRPHDDLKFKAWEPV